MAKNHACTEMCLWKSVTTADGSRTLLVHEIEVEGNGNDSVYRGWVELHGKHYAAIRHGASIVYLVGSEIK